MSPPSRDRLSRPIDISTMFKGAARKVDLKVDEPGLRYAGLSGSRVGRNYRRPIAGGKENRTPGKTVRCGRGRGRVVPHRYPRTPLRDITAIVRAIERKRAQLHQNDEAQAPQEHETNAIASSSTSSAQLKHEAVCEGASTSLPNPSVKPLMTPDTQVSKLMAHIVNEKGTDSDSVTPQKRLLDSIDKVREVLVDERRKLEKNPADKKAEREKKVRTLMSMR